MQESIYNCRDNANYMVYCPNPKEFWETWNFPKQENLEVGSKSYKDLCQDVYTKAHYGYVLRDDITVKQLIEEFSGCLSLDVLSAYRKYDNVKKLF